MSLNITVTLRRRERTRVLAELHQPEDQAVRHVGAEPFQGAARLVETVAGIVDLAQPRAAVERLVELQPLDRLGGRGDGADRARHRQPDQQRQQGGDSERGAADDGAVGQPVEVAGGLLQRKVLPDQPGLGAVAQRACGSTNTQRRPSASMTWPTPPRPRSSCGLRIGGDQIRASTGSSTSLMVGNSRSAVRPRPRGSTSRRCASTLVVARPG